MTQKQDEQGPAKRRKVMRAIVLVLALVVGGGFCGSSFAQEREASSEGEAALADQETWIRLWKRIQEIRMDMMKEELQFDRETMDRLTPQLTALAKKKREIGKERLLLLRELKSLSQNKANQAALDETMEKLEANNASLAALRQEEMAHIKTHLSSEQQAKYIIFQRKFKGDLRALIQKEREAYR